jgi:hypothetical protein
MSFFSRLFEKKEKKTVTDKEEKAVHSETGHGNSQSIAYYQRVREYCCTKCGIDLRLIREDQIFEIEGNCTVTSVPST